VIKNKARSPGLFGRVKEFLKVTVLRGKRRKRYFPSINRRGRYSLDVALAGTTERDAEQH
jgi:hypothetical protein